MAKANSTAISSATTKLQGEEHHWGKFYRGTEASLVATGLVRPEWFPGKPGNPKHTVHLGMIDGMMKIMPYLSMPENERYEKTEIILRKEGSNFAASIHFSKEERERKSLRKEIEKLHSEKQKELDRAPKNIEEFRISKSESIEWFLRGMFDMFRRASNGYHYSRKVTEEASDLISDLMELAEEGQVYFDQQRQDYFLDDVEKKAQKSHPEFSAFMATTLAIGKAALND